MAMKLKPLNYCPTPQAWGEEIEREHIAPRWLAHLEQCTACQQVLDQLAAEPALWHEAQETLADRTVDLTHIIDSVVPLAAVPLREDLCDPMCEYELAQLQRLLPPLPESAVSSFNAASAGMSASQPIACIGRYELEQLIGRGGMGLVFRAWDTQLHRVVAVKTLSMSLWAMPAARERFIREGRAAAMLTHPNIVPMYDVINDPPVPALVMQYIAGPTLEDWIQSHGSLPWSDALRIAMQLADALCAAHKEGLVHRDIKPGNVLLEADGTRALLTDFGLVRAMDDVTLTQSGLLAGTPHFMSPEQAKGEEVDGRSDLFSLGSLIYYCISGQTPFRGRESMSVLNALCHSPHVPLCKVNETVPVEVSRLVDRLLQKQATQRTASSEELRETLRKLLASERCLRPKRKRNVQVSLRAVALACAAMAAIGLWLLPSWISPRVNNTPRASSFHTSTPDYAQSPDVAMMSEGMGASVPIPSRSFVLPALVPTELDALSKELHELDVAMEQVSSSIETRVGQGDSFSAAVWEASQELDRVRSNLSDKN